MEKPLTPTEYYQAAYKAIEELLNDYKLITRCKNCLFYDTRTHLCKNICRFNGEEFYADEDFYCKDGINKWV